MPLANIRRSIFGSTKSSKAAEAYYTPPPTPPPATSRKPYLRCPVTQVGTEAPQHNGAPPSYSVATTSPPEAAADDAYTFLSTFDTLLLIDDSSSMSLPGRWSSISLALRAIVPIITRYDSDGIDILFLNTPSQAYHSNVRDASTVHDIFRTVRPYGATPTGQRLNSILKPYVRKCKLAHAQGRAAPKPINIIVITDGEPSDDVESPIISAAKKLDALDAVAWQVGIQFFQVGGDAAAKRHLEELDDCLAEMGGGCRDIVDTVPFVGGDFNGEGILKVVLGAVNRRLDRRRGVVV